MSVANPRRTWADVDLPDAVRDFLREEVVAIGHIAPRGAVHLTDFALLAHTGGPSVFNRGVALDLDQPDVTFGEIDEFFDGLPHTLWLEADVVDQDADALLRGRGYVPMPPQHGVATTSFPDELVTKDPTHGATLLTDPAQAANVADVTATGFGLGVDDRLLFEDLSRGVLRHARPWNHGAIYAIKGADGTLVSVGSMLCTADVAGITGLATLPMHRHQRHSTNLISRALHDAHALGYQVAVSVATPDSGKLFEQLGFEPVIDYRVYRQTRP